jgi:Lysozyme like domain
MASLYGLAQNAGFSDSDAVIAAAIAWAESGGDPSVYNAEAGAPGGTPQGQGSYGLWQIYLRDHPEFAGQNLYDPQTNANAAFRVYQKQGWNAWSTFKSGAYRQYLPTADEQPPITVDAGSSSPTDATAAPWLDPATSFRASISAPPSTDNFGKYLLWGAVGLAVLWLFEEVS